MASITPVILQEPYRSCRPIALGAKFISLANNSLASNGCTFLGCLQLALLLRSCAFQASKAYSSCFDPARTCCLCIAWESAACETNAAAKSMSVRGPVKLFRNRTRAANLSSSSLNGSFDTSKPALKFGAIYQERSRSWTQERGLIQLESLRISATRVRWR